MQARKGAGTDTTPSDNPALWTARQNNFVDEEKKQQLSLCDVSKTGDICLVTVSWGT